MGNSIYLSSLSKEQYDDLTKSLWGIQNHKCFICEKEIDLDVSKTNIDHIKPLVNGGKDDVSNMALTHEHCNKSKQDADLIVAKKLAVLTKIMEQASENKETPSLKHVLKYYGGSKYSFNYKIEDGFLKYSFDDIGDLDIKTAQVFEDSLSDEKFAFISVPLEYLYHDEIINPRGINSSISLLVKEFHKPNPQVLLSLARLDNKQIKVFDGQHKAVAQILLDVKAIVVRLFINPDVERLIETNTNAGSKLKQIAFDKSIVRQLHDTLYAERLAKYQKDHYLSEDDFSFSEELLVNHFKGERGNVKLYIINSQKNSITRNQDNKLQAYINFEGRGNDLPLSYSTFEKTLLSRFINSKTILKTPINYKIDEGLNPRLLEKEQLIHLCNSIANVILIGKYDSDIGTYRIENTIANGKGDSIPDDHLIAYRLMKEEIMYNWIKYIEKLIVGYFSMTGIMYDSENLFQQLFPEKLWEKIETFLENLRDLTLWKDRSMASTIFGGKNTYDFWLSIFQSGKTPDGQAVLVTPINYVEMSEKK